MVSARPSQRDGWTRAAQLARQGTRLKQRESPGARDVKDVPDTPIAGRAHPLRFRRVRPELDPDAVELPAHLPV